MNPNNSMNSLRMLRIWKLISIGIFYLIEKYTIHLIINYSLSKVEVLINKLSEGYGFQSLKFLNSEYQGSYYIYGEFYSRMHWGEISLVNSKKITNSTYLVYFYS